MKIKKEYVILLAIIGILSLYLFKHDSDQTHYQIPPLKNIPTMEISKLEIVKTGNAIELNRKSGKWQIGSQAYPADFEKIQDILNIVEELKLDTLVSEAKIYNRYDLTENKRITVKAYKEDKILREIEIGKAAASVRHTYVKLAGDPNVYHARNNFRTKVDVTEDDLRDKTVLTFDKETVNEIIIARDGQEFAFKNQPTPVDLNVAQDSKTTAAEKAAPADIWMRSDQKMAEGAKLVSLMSSLSKLKCDSFINDKQKDDFKDAIHSVTLKGVEEVKLSIFKQRDGDTEKFPAISSANDYPFLLPKMKVEQIMKKPDEFLVPPKDTTDKKTTE